MIQTGIKLAASAIALWLACSAAQAQATRTWVSGVGDDANPCSRTAPCKTFAGAISKTAAKGEISVLDPGGFGAVTITKSISIVAEGVEGGVLASLTNGIIVNAGAADQVFIKGLQIEGAGNGVNGIRFLGGLRLYVEDTVIRGFTGNGIDMVNSTQGGRVMLDNVVITASNGGVYVHSAGALNIAVLNDTVLDANTTFGLKVEGASSRAILNNSVLSGSPSALLLATGGTAQSFGNNVITSGSDPTTTSPLK